MASKIHAAMGGVLAGAAVALFMAAGRRRGYLHETLAERSEDWTDRIADSRSRIGAGGTTALEQINHLAASAAFGLGFGYLRDRLPNVPALALGAGYGAALYAVNIGLIAPRLGITEGERAAGRGTALQRLGVHLLYGTGTAVATRAIEALGASAPAPASASAAERRFAQVGEVRMSWIEEGEGMPVVLLHGIPTSPELWREVVPRLSGVRALAWEMVGYGASIEEGIGWDISVARQADYLADWLRHLGINRAVLVGHDLGGGVAQILAVRRPDLCGGLLLTNAIGYDSWPIPSVKALRATAPVAARLPNPLFKGLLANLFARGHDDSAKASAALSVHGRHYLERRGAADLVRQIESLDVGDTLAVAPSLPTLGVPARIVWGEADKFQTIEYGERFARDLDAPLRRIEGGKHFTPEDHPGIIAEEIMALVAAVRKAESGTRPAAPAARIKERDAAPSEG